MVKKTVLKNEMEKYGKVRKGGEKGVGVKREVPDGRFVLLRRVAEEVIKQPFHLRLLG